MSQSSKICPECRLLAFNPAKVVPVDCVESTKWEDYGAVPLNYVLEDTYPAIPRLRHGRDEYGCVICRFLGRVIWSYLLANPHLKTSASVDIKLELWEYHPQLGSVKFGNSLLPGNIRGRISISGEEHPIRIETRNSSQGMLCNSSTAFLLLKGRSHFLGYHRAFAGTELLDLNIIRQIKMRLHECSNAENGSHKYCPKARGSWESPLRLIEVLQGDFVRLVEAKNLDSVRYAILSYCWGTSNTAFNARTVLSNLDKRMMKFPLTDLPTTLRDSVRFTRLLGVQYIWIDAICICQDSGEWASESTKMMQYYENAYFTTAPIMCASSNGSFFQTRPTFVSEMVTYDTGERLQFHYPNLLIGKTEMDSSAWNSRGWTFQEQLLSSRVLYIGEHQMSWECREGSQTFSATPTQLSMSEGLYTDNHYLPVSLEDAAGSTEWSDIDRLRNKWYFLLGQYAGRKLTNESDKLIALHGVATKFGQLFGLRDTYISGFWKNDLWNSLLWRILGETKPPPKSKSFPSWSWCSMNVALTWPEGTGNIPCADLIEWETVSNAPTSDTNTVVRVLVVEAYVFPAALLKAKLPPEVQIQVQLDDTSAFEDTDDAKLSALVLTSYSENEEDQDYAEVKATKDVSPVDLSGLIVRQSEDHRSQGGYPKYARIGWFEIEWESNSVQRVRVDYGGILQGVDALPDSVQTIVSNFFSQVWRNKGTIALG